MHNMNNFKVTTKLTEIKYLNKYRLIITSNIITQIPLIMLSNKKMKWEVLGQVNASGL